MQAHHAEVLIRKLESITALSDSDREALRVLPMQVTPIRADQDIVREGDRPSRSCLLIEGFAAAYKMTGEGKRQIISFQYPGDIPDLQSLHLGRIDTGLSSLSACTVAFIRHEELRKLCHDHRLIGDALWRVTLMDAAIFREWIVNVGQRDAFARVAHLLMEALTRLEAVGLADGDSCELPITQTELADATGVSSVHINRILQELRSLGLIELRGKRLIVLDRKRLTQSGDFDPAYLNLN